MNDLIRNILLWIAIFIGATSIYGLLGGGLEQNNTQEATYSEFLSLVEGGTVQNVTVRGNELIANPDSEQPIVAQAPYDPELITELRNQGVNIKAESAQSGNSWWIVILNWLPWLLFIGVWIYFMKQMQGGAGKAFSFGKSKAKLLNEAQERKTFADVAGVNEAKEELVEIVDFLKDPTRFQKLGGKIPKGVLLVGPPGTGKTLLARAVAGEAGVPFFSISGSDFVEMFVGVGASRVRDLFEQGKKNAPCIVFIDEIDAVGRHRGGGIGGGNDEREQTLNQLLVEMDGFESTEGVILVAATNRPDVLDPALLRPGRFDRQVTVPLPDIDGREKILQVHMQKVPLSPDVEPRVIARGTPGFSGADLANLVNEAALMAARKDKRLVDMDDFEHAKDKVMMGPERRSTVMTDEQKKTTAYHEAGHALVNLGLKGPTDPVHKVTIIPRGRALGVTMSLPEEDRFTYDSVYLENQIAILYGGRLAEELVLNQMTTGASNDIEKATDLARKMVTTWGMSKKLGPLNYGENETQMFLGRDIQRRHDVAEATSAEIDEEIRQIIDTQYHIAKKILEARMDDLHKFADALLEHETLERSQIEDMLAGKPIVKKQPRKRPQAKSAAKKAAAKKPAAKKPAKKASRQSTKK